MLTALAASATGYHLAARAPVHGLSTISRPHARASSLLMTAAVEEDCGCDTPAGGVMVAGRSVTAQSLRDMSLVDAEGRKVSAGDLIGQEGKAVVIFLRHLG